MMILFPLLSSRTSHFDLMWNLPFPVEYMSKIPSMPWIDAPVGKSGPVICSMYFSIESSGVCNFSSPCSIISFTWRLTAPATSVKLCGGIFVAIPTAIPSLPLSSKLGSFAGNTVGSFSESSKFGSKSTVFFSISPSIWFAILSSLLSV